MVDAGNKIWCVDGVSGMLANLNINTGAVDWELSSTQFGKTNARSLAQNESLVFFTSSSGKVVNAINPVTNQVVWSTDLRAGGSDSDLQSYVMDGGLIYENGYVYHVAERGRMTVLNASTGAIVHTYDATGFPERVFWSPHIVNGGTVYSCGIDGKIYAIQFNLN